jgi:dipeptide/tripeptide permease
VIDLKFKAVAVGVFFFATAVGQTLSTVIVGQLVGKYNLNTAANINGLGYVMALNTAVPSFIAAFCFYFSGPHYAKWKEQFVKEKKEANDLASQIETDDGATVYDGIVSVLRDASSISATQQFRL